MLTGLLFAVRDAEDRPDRLAATLPFAGATLIEQQARQLVAAGASQLIVVVSRLTPELLGAVSRIGRKGVTVDAVRTAAEAAEKLHPLARVLMLADGLVTTDRAVDAMAREGGDALLVLPEEGAAPSFERVGGHMAWAGIARLQPQRVGEVAALPREYDMQSTLIRVASQARAGHVALPGELLVHGHGIALGEQALAERGRRVLAAFFSGRRNWFDRFVVAPAAQQVLPPLVTHGVSAAMTMAGSLLVGMLGGLALFAGHGAVGLALTFVGTLGLTVGATLGRLRSEAELARWQSFAAVLLPGIAVLLFGWNEGAIAADGAALATAIGVVTLGGLGERAIAERGSWWGSPPAYLALLLMSVIAGVATPGLGVTAIYAAATLAAAIEKLRPQP